VSSGDPFSNERFSRAADRAESADKYLVIEIICAMAHEDAVRAVRCARL
jgi:hypothetical protein